MISISALWAYPEPRNRHLKPQKTIREVSVSFCCRKASHESFMRLQMVIAQLRIGVPDRKTGRCLYPELPGTSPQEGRNAGPGPPCSGEKSQLEPRRDGENMRRDGEEPILDVTFPEVSRGIY